MEDKEKLQIQLDLLNLMIQKSKEYGNEGIIFNAILIESKFEIENKIVNMSL